MLASALLSGAGCSPVLAQQVAALDEIVVAAERLTLLGSAATASE